MMVVQRTPTRKKSKTFSFDKRSNNNEKSKSNNTIHQKSNRKSVFDSARGEVDFETGLPSTMYSRLERRVVKSHKTRILDISHSNAERYNETSTHAFTSIPSIIFDKVNLKSLTQLWLTNNKIAFIPPEIKRFSALKTLGLAGNELSSLPEEIGNLTCLKSLFLERNKLKSLPVSLSHLKSLVDLNVSHNSLTFPTFLSTRKSSSSSSIRRLGISHNNIKELPSYIPSSLVELDVSYNSLGPDLPIVLLSLTNLRRLDLTGNKFQNDSLQSLKALYASCQELRVSSSNQGTTNYYNTKTAKFLRKIE